MLPNSFFQETLHFKDKMNLDNSITFFTFTVTFITSAFFLLNIQLTPIIQSFRHLIPQLPKTPSHIWTAASNLKKKNQACLTELILSSPLFYPLVKNEKFFYYFKANVFAF